MSLLVTALIVGGGALVAGIGARIAFRRRKRAPESIPEKPAPSRLAAAGFEVEQGDVISARGRELWLEQGWLLSEGHDAVAALLFAREAVVLVQPRPRPRTAVLAAIELPLPADPPSAIDHGGVRYERAKRLPVSIEALSQSPEPPWSDALLTEYRGLANEVLWALVTPRGSRAWSGHTIDEHEIERWGGGADTLAR